MNWKKFAMVGVLAGSSIFVGCKSDREEAREDMNEAREELREEGTGGSGQIGDGKVGRNEGVLNDGEGPLEENRRNDDTTIGRNPGVINDGEGPTKDDKIGNNKGVINDGEGPIEENVNEEDMKR
jgi:hypothetical protein